MANHNLIIGGGPAAINAIETIRQFDGGESKITIVSDEPAHSRMTLPYWLAGDIPQEQTLTGDDTYFGDKAVETRFAVRVRSIDSANNSVTLDDGSTIGYDNLLIATGSSPLTPSIPGADLPGVQPLWTLDQTASVLQIAQKVEKPRVVLVGAGFVGLIMLNAMFKRGWQVTVVEREQQILPRMLDRDGAGLVADWLEERGVAAHTGAAVESITQSGDSKTVRLSSGESIDADIVVLGIGVRPNTELAAEAGLNVDQGIVVNDQMRTSVSNIYAAGDVAQGPDLLGGEPAVHAIQPTAVDHGRVAGANMAGRDVRYPGSLVMNIADVCGLQCASCGNWNSDSAEHTTILNSSGKVYRKLLWSGDQITGSIFIGRPSDMGMLTDVGMVKGLIQTRTPLGPWKEYLQKNPHDVRRAYAATGVAAKLVNHSLLGTPTDGRTYRHGGAQPSVPRSGAHSVLVGTKE